ncbi:MAG: NADH-quinone oxidoreductase subunit J [Methanosarcinales archaeon]|nr:NADH-quinone oxidoreductase subunit J [Methanosarcinales archaeon]
MEQLSNKVGNMINLLTALLLLGVFVAAILSASATNSWGEVEDIMFTEWEDGSSDTSAIEHVGGLLFTKYVIPFEVLSLVLLAALLGSLYMAKKEEDE